MIPLQLQHLFKGHFSVYPSINIHLYQEKIIAIVKKMRLQLRCGNFIFDPRFDNNGNNTFLVGDSILFDFDQGPLPIDVLALRGGRTSDLHDLYSLMGSYDRVVLLVGGNDLNDWRKRNVDGESELPPREILYVDCQPACRDKRNPLEQTQNSSSHMSHITEAQACEWVFRNCVRN